MRFAVKIKLDDVKGLFIPFNYRRHFLSLIKEAILTEDKELFEKYYKEKSANKVKPFTFSVAFSAVKEQKEKGKIFLESGNINFFISSFSPEFLITVYNGLQKLKGENLKYLGTTIKIERFFYINRRHINNGSVTFKTLSPILVRDIENKKGKGFIDSSHPDFEKNIFYNVKSLSKHFIDYELLESDFKILSTNFSSKRTSLYGKEISNKGFITIKAPVKVLQMLYDAGLGAKRSQGFGILEVVE